MICEITFSWTIPGDYTPPRGERFAAALIAGGRRIVRQGVLADSLRRAVGPQGGEVSLHVAVGEPGEGKPPAWRSLEA